MAEPFKIRITHNGPVKDLEVHEDEQMSTVLERAIKLFSLQRQPHQMGLFTEANVQVAGPNINQTVKQADLKHDQLLVLRQVVVEGGAA
jgi:hypothetical protein